MFLLLVWLLIYFSPQSCNYSCTSLMHCEYCQKMHVLHSFLILKLHLFQINCSLKALKAHMRSKPCWKTTKNNEKTVTAHGRKSFSLLISDVLNKNKENISYNGKFNEDDILLGETFCWIYSQQLENQPTQLCCRSQLHLDCHGTFL